MNKSTLYGTSGLATAGALPGVRLTIVSLGGSNGSSAEAYLLLFDGTAVPAPGAVPTLPCVTIPPASGGSSGQVSLNRDDLGDEGAYFEKGLAWAVSTSRTSYAPPADASKFSVVILRA